MKKLLIVIAVLFTLARCKVGDVYHRPDFQAPHSFYGGKSAIDSVWIDSTQLADIPWRQYFKDSTLIRLIDSALINNINMQRAVENVEKSLQDLKQSKASFYPAIGADPLGFQREYHSENYNNYGSNRSRRIHGENPPKTLYTERLSYTSGLSTSWEIGIWGKLRRQKDAARAAYMQTKEFKKAVQTTLVASIASTYYDMLMIKAKIEVAKKSLALNDSTLKIVKLQYDAGEVTSLAIEQTQSQKLRAQSLIPQLERAYSVEENYLNNLLGRPPRFINMTTDLGEVDFMNNYAAGIPLSLVKNRPDVAASEYSLIIANEEVGIAQAMKYPTLSITASGGLDSYQFKNLFDPLGSGFALINSALFQPIFQQRKLKTRHKKAIADRNIAQLDFKDKLITAINEVSDAMITIKKSEEEYGIAQERIKLTRKQVKDAVFLFRSGFANYLEVITAQGDALESELELINIKAQLFISNIELYRSLGGGWQG